MQTKATMNTVPKNGNGVSALDRVMTEVLDHTQPLPALNFIDPIIPIKREDLANGRWYRPTDEWWEENGDTEDIPMFQSVTTIDQVIEKGYGFHKALGDATSYKDWMEYVNECADKGTFLHEQYRLAIYGIPLDLTVPAYCESKEAMIEWKEETKKHLLSFKAFWKEYTPEVLACEIPLLNIDKDNKGNYRFPFAGTADLICNIINPKTNKSERWLIDFKTGNQYKQHQLQLTAYKMLWNSMFPQLPIKRIACLHTKSTWRNIDKPTYTLKEYKYVPYLFRKVFQAHQWLNSDARGNPPKPKWGMELPDVFILEDNNNESEEKNGV
jgi:hypothetical protein